MFCSKCGAELEEGAKFCANCGARVEGADPYNLENRVDSSYDEEYNTQDYYDQEITDVSAAYLKAQAKMHLKGNLGTAILCVIIAGLVRSIPVVGNFICGGCLSFGLVTVFIKIADGRKPSVENVFDGFTTDFIGCFCTALLTTIYTVLWSIIPVAGFILGIIKSFSYSMTMYIKHDHPELGANQAVTASKLLMKGRKWQLFCLYFSFIIWIIIGIFTLGIALVVWVIPYIDTAEAEFYNHYIKPNYASVVDQL